jgi:repressor LexA
MRTKDEGKINKIAVYIEEYYERNEYTPTVAKLASEFGMSDSSMHRYLSEMAERGMIEINRGEWRGIRTKSICSTRENAIKVPLVGTVACGEPIWAVENIEKYLYFSAALLGYGAEYFMLRAKGDSMIDAGIDDGDLVVIKKQNYANEGQIVVALIDDEATLKRFYRDEKRQQVRLHPENDNYEDMFFYEIIIQGVAIKIIKDID